MPALVTGQISKKLSWLTEDQIYFPERYVLNSQDNKVRFIKYWHSLTWRERPTGVEYFVVIRLLKKHKKNNYQLRHTCSPICLSLRPTKDLNLNSLGTYRIPCEWGKVYSGQTGDHSHQIQGTPTPYPTAPTGDIDRGWAHNLTSSMGSGSVAPIS
jgi:hypothetical protein